MELQLSLHNIETDLRELALEREEAESADVVAMIDAEIQRYIEAEIRKCDGIADFCVHLDALQKDIDGEIKRLQARQYKVKRTLDRIKDTVKFVMAGMPWKEGKPRKIEGVRHTISLRGNGGKQAVVVTDESLVPDAFKRVTITVDLEIAHYMRVASSSWKYKNQLWDSLDAGKPEVSLSRISDELNKPCIQCEGTGERKVFESDTVVSRVKCPECAGTGKQSVPGARLEERGESVHIS